MKISDWSRIAEDYHSYIISPFQKEVQNPLFEKLDAIKNSKKKVVGDIGCGRGEVLNQLASRFKKVYAMDFSPVMIRIAKKNSTKENIEFLVKDMRHMQAFRNKFDVVVSVNSILMPEIRDVRKAMNSVFSSLKKGGKLYAVFPSMESVLYQGFLILEEQIARHKDEKKALRIAKRILERNKYNFIKGTFDYDGEMQKFYYDFELKIRLKDTGFKNIRLSKVLYPWGKDIGDFKDFPGRPEMWDWFVSAEK